MRRALQGAATSRIVGWAVLLGAACWIAAGQPQHDTPRPDAPIVIAPDSSTMPGVPADSASRELLEKQMQARNIDRQKRIVTDTDRLVSLAKELKEQVVAPDKPLDPGDAGKKAEEIEKLAKGIKDRMKG